VTVAGFGWIDGMILAAYFVVSLGIGLWAGRRESSTSEFFLGGRRQHWLLAGISIIATEVSAMTLIGVPAQAFKGDWHYLQMYAGAFLGRVIIAFLLLPAFYGGSVTTVYEYLGQRFGPGTRTTTSLLFFASRTIGSGLRLLLASLAISEVFGWSLEWVIVGSTAVAIGYTTFGGIKAILWTDVFQASIFLGASLVAIAYLFHVAPGSWIDTLSAAQEAGKFRTLIWDSNPNNEECLWVLVISSTISNMAAFGTDQDMTQRMLTCKNLRDGQRSLLFNAVVGFPIVCSFLLIGSLLWVYYSALGANTSGRELPEQVDRIFPFFIATALPANVGLKGLLVTAIFAASMSSFASALGALSSSAVTDLYRPWCPMRPDEHYLKVARISVLGFGIVLVIIAFGFRGGDSLLWEALKWPGLMFGAMLGVFLLGVCTRSRGDDRVNVVAMLTSVVGLVLLKLVQERWGHTVYIAWPWWVVIGTAWTLGLGACFRTKQASAAAKSGREG